MKEYRITGRRSLFRVEARYTTTNQGVGRVYPWSVRTGTVSSLEEAREDLKRAKDYDDENDEPWLFVEGPFSDPKGEGE